jgi:hypothetical protein
VKTVHKKKTLTFGEFIAGIYETCGGQKAEGIVRLAVTAQWVEFSGQHRFMIFEDFNPESNP